MATKERPKTLEEWLSEQDDRFYNCDTCGEVRFEETCDYCDAETRPFSGQDSYELGLLDEELPEVDDEENIIYNLFATVRVEYQWEFPESDLDGMDPEQYASTHFGESGQSIDFITVKVEEVE